MRSLRDIVSLVLALGLVTTLLSYALAQEPRFAEPHASPVSDVIFPRQVLPLTFSHQQHLRDFDVDCRGCHTNIDESASSLDNNLPREEDCLGCHAIDRSDFDKDNGPGRAPGDCRACHPGFDSQSGRVQRVQLPIPNLKFSHKAHLARNVRCEQCHGDFVAQKVDLATREQLPKMRTCLGCHDGKEAPAVCSTCHLTEAGGVLRTQFPGIGVLAPSGSLQAAAHDMNFRTSHKYAAQNDQEFCASCHKKDFCADCHNGSTKPMDFHSGDYVNMHAIEARRNAPDCSSCHRVQTFCQACHSRLGVAGDQKSSDFGELTSYHPEGWTFPTLLGRSTNHHSYQAQRNIKQCASCHRESFCTQCHSSKAWALGIAPVNPHPRGWRGSTKCRALLKRAKRMCLRCHVEAREIDCDG